MSLQSSLAMNVSRSTFAINNSSVSCALSNACFAGKGIFQFSWHIAKLPFSKSMILSIYLRPKEGCTSNVFFCKYTSVSTPHLQLPAAVELLSYICWNIKTDSKSKYRGSTQQNLTDSWRSNLFHSSYLRTQLNQRKSHGYS